ncbi:MAG: family 10 glycosylhydrolase, partial [Ignavibacteria bacterium]
GDFRMLDPGIPAVRDYITKVAADIAGRYNVDGIHFDDYFYPYAPKISNEDSLSFALYGHGFYDIKEWRRNNINLLVAQVYDKINSVNHQVKFGISPFGILENKYADTKGFESYSVLYGDPLTWIKQKTVDYLVPQIYWKIGDEKADFAKLLPWWASVADDINLFTGMFASKFTDPKYEGNKNEISDQIKMARNTLNVNGIVFFSSKTIFRNFSGFADSLKSYFKYPALIPLMTWKDSIPPKPPVNLAADGDYFSRTLTWKAPGAAADGDSAKRFVIYRFDEKDYLRLDEGEKSFNLDNPEFIIHITNGIQDSFEDSEEIHSDEIIYMITALDKSSNESNPAEFIFTSNSEKKDW